MTIGTSCYMVKNSCYTQVEQRYNLLYYIKFKLGPLSLLIYYQYANIGASAKENWP